MMIKRLRAFRGNRDGDAAIEFALVSIALAIVLLGSWEGWQLATRETAAQTAVNAGAMYYLQGGANDTAAQDFALAAWPNRPSDATISITRSCACGETATSCSTLCSGQTPPRIFITVAAQSLFNDGLASYAVDHSEVVRVR